MAVSNTAYSTNSVEILVQNEFTSNNLIAEVNTAITSLGWSNYDTINQTDYSPVVTQVYRCLNADSTTYKYAILRWNTLKMQLNLSCAEDWNTGDKFAINESWHNKGLFYIGYDIFDSRFLVAATDRHLVLQNYIRNEPGIWAAILEFERVAAEDISQNSAPCFAYTNSLMFGTPWGQTANNVPSRYMMAFPRTPDNQTDAYAAKVYAPVTTRGMYPPYYPSANTANTGANSVIIVNTHDGNALHLGSFYNTLGTWGWDPTKAVVSPVTVDHIFKSMPFGRIYNAGITKPIGQGSFDSVYLNADSTGGWPASTGSNTEFLTLALNGGSETEFANTLNRLSVSWSNNFSVIWGSVTAVGNTVWAAANNGVWTWDMNSGANTTAIQRYVNTNGVVDIMFDGVRSIYGTTNNGIVQIDTQTYATNTNSSASDLGCGLLEMDQKYIYCTNRARNARPKLYVFARANNNLMRQMNSGAVLSGITGYSKPTPDYKGFVYSSIQQGAQAATTGHSRLIVWNSEAANANDGLANLTWSTVTTVNWQTSFYYEYNSDELYFFVNRAGQGDIVIFNNVPNTNVWTTRFLFSSSWTSTSVQSNMTYSPAPSTNAAYDHMGGLVLTPRRGWLHITPRRVGAPQTSQTAFSTLVSLSHPDSAFGTGRPFNYGNMTVNDIFNNANGWASHQYTNGIRIFQTLWRSNNEARIVTLGNLYPNTQYNTYATGRLLIKA